MAQAVSSHTVFAIYAIGPYLTQLPKSAPSRVINHVAVSVADVEAVVAWYTNVLGFQLIGNKDLRNPARRSSRRSHLWHLSTVAERCQDRLHVNG